MYSKILQRLIFARKQVDERLFFILYIFFLYIGNYDLRFLHPTYDTWHSFLKWKYEDGYLVNLALDQVLTLDGAKVSLAERSTGTTTTDSQKWSLDYNGKISQ